MSSTNFKDCKHVSKTSGWGSIEANDNVTIHRHNTLSWYGQNSCIRTERTRSCCFHVNKPVGVVQLNAPASITSIANVGVHHMQPANPTANNEVTFHTDQQLTPKAWTKLPVYD